MSLTALRTELADALADVAARVYTFIPENVHAPAVLISPADPYVTTEGEPFGHYRAAYTLTVIGTPGTNEKTTAALDELIVAVIDAVAGEFAVGSVAQPVAYQANNVLHLAADLTVSCSTTL